jgi:uncharacterized protein YndB with AHSA1/START domain
MSGEGRRPAAPARRITLERTWQATLEEVWALWTTRDGIEAWWGPEGFRVEVRSIDLRPGGRLRYAMIASAPETIAFMKREGMPTVQEVHLTYTEVAPQRRLAWLHCVDFVPGMTPYDVASEVELHPAPGGVRLVLVLDAMHDETWTGRAVAGWEMELGKLGRLLEARRGA